MAKDQTQYNDPEEKAQRKADKARPDAEREELRQGNLSKSD
jgi:hypothetical protein